ncbi:MAG: LemA family protein [Pseudomonadota bacterium]
MLYILVAVAVVLALGVIVIYNQLVAMRQTCRQGWADIDAQLRQRHDLIPNLVNAVKGYAEHEKSTLEEVIKARNNAVSAQQPGDLAKAEDILSSALRKLFALAEAYPDLKANTNFLSLQNELADVEDKLAAARRAYNGVVARYNGAVESFPAVLFAGSLGFKHRDFWELAESERSTIAAAPEVSFSNA